MGPLNRLLPALGFYGERDFEVPPFVLGNVWKALSAHLRPSCRKWQATFYSCIQAGLREMPRPQPWRLGHGVR